MLLAQLHDELTRAAAGPRPMRRRWGRTVRAFAAALVTLLIAAPTAQAGLAEAPLATTNTTGHAA
jgi:hypothetical protein